jgi:hypothetical protein
VELLIFDLPIPGSQISEIERYLASRGTLLAAFSKDTSAICSISTYLEQQSVHNTTTFMLIDRQILSFIKQIATGRAISDADRKLVSAIMCFAVLSHIQIEPNMAIYEYADATSTDHAWQDVCILRYADNLGFSLWHSLFTGKLAAVPSASRFSVQTQQPPPPRGVNFRQRLRLFNFCLPFVLKLALLERGGGKPLQKMTEYLDWMHNEYFFGAPGVLFGNLFLSPSREHKMIKNIGSSDHSKRLSGIRNACWDITFVQQWLEYIKKPAVPPRLWIACSSDKALVKTAGRMFASQTDIDACVKKSLDDDWGVASGSRLFEHYRRLQSTREIARRPANQNLPAAHWERLRNTLEAQL